jgi:hypothetical protein
MSHSASCIFQIYHHDHTYVSEIDAQHLLPLLDGQHHIDDIIWAACVSRETLDKLIADHKEFLVKTLRL